ncbi:MAG: ABC transporter ATP-binding protein [Alphaproteobacteria bacterium]|nr:ABC transporter ATP-binding protein [Alphaproteobacteria bacterium]
MLEIRNLVVDHGELRAIWDVSLDVEAGERVGLLGANGAGKSTTLGAILGIYKASGGHIRYKSAEIANREAVQNVEAGIALVPEGRQLFPEMKVRENLEMGAYPRSARGKVAENLDRIFDLFPILREKQNQNANELSGGQQQMVAIGRALMSSPQLLLLDEPFLGVAPVIIEEVMAALNRLADQGVTFLLVEQNIHRAMEFVERAYVIENGRTVLAGSKQQLLGDPEFSNKFLGLD